MQLVSAGAGTLSQAIGHSLRLWSLGPAASLPPEGRLGQPALCFANSCVLLVCKPD